MKAMLSYVLFIVSLLFISYSVVAQDLLLIKDGKEVLDIAQNVSIYEDKTNCLDIQKILDTDIQKQFVKHENATLSFGFSRSSFWIKLSLINNNYTPLALQIKNVLLDSIQVFVVENEQVILSKQAGLLIPFRERDVKTNYYIFDLPLTRQSVYDIYIRNPVIHINFLRIFTHTITTKSDEILFYTLAFIFCMP